MLKTTQNEKQQEKRAWFGKPELNTKVKLCCELEQKNRSITFPKKADQYTVNPVKAEIKDQELLARITLTQVKLPLPASSELLSFYDIVQYPLDRPSCPESGGFPILGDAQGHLDVAMGSPI